MNRIKRIRAKLQYKYIESRLFINKMLRLPAQTKKEILILKRVFDNFAIGGGKIKIFEWGSGLSTIYYAQYLRKKSVEFEWHSVDNNKMWYEKVIYMLKKKNLQSAVRVYLREFAPFWEKRGWGVMPPPCGAFSPGSENEKAYINFPGLLNEKFDIVIIDGRFRRHCYQVAREILSPQGVVILHDAQKTHYHAGLENFRYARFLISGWWYPFQKVSNKIWLGSMQNTRLFNGLDNFLACRR